MLGRGASRLSARELMYEMERQREAGISQIVQKPTSRRSPIGDRLPEDVRRKLMALMGKNEGESGE